jgi:hypothetical protein
MSIAVWKRSDENGQKKVTVNEFNSWIQAFYTTSKEDIGTTCAFVIVYFLNGVTMPIVRHAWKWESLEVWSQTKMLGFNLTFFSYVHCLLCHTPYFCTPNFKRIKHVCRIMTFQEHWTMHILIWQCTIFSTVIQYRNSFANFVVDGMNIQNGLFNAVIFNY